MSDHTPTLVDTIATPLRWQQTPDGAWTLRAGSIAAGRVTRGCGAEPSWLGTSFGGSLAYHGTSIADAMEAVLLDVTRVLAGVDDGR